MLQVVDSRTGKSLDVRRMLGIANEDIKDDKLREEISNYSILNSQKIGKHEQEEVADMGDYFAKLDVLEFDMGKFEDGDAEPTTNAKEERKDEQTPAPKRAAWADWWHYKQIQNDKLKQAIIDNNKDKVVELLTDDNLMI
jgi:hypothetical protein